MSTRQDRAADGARAITETRRRLGVEIRLARLTAGLSQRSAGAAAGMSHAQWGRIERSQCRQLTIDQATRAAMAVGLRLVASTYPEGDAVRDAAQLGLLDRFRSRLPPGTPWRTEVPLPMLGDRRAWDAMIELSGELAGCEAETKLFDIQALERRLALKLRDGGVDVLLLVVADTAANRRVLSLHRGALRELLPLDGRQVLGALRHGRLPPTNGLVVSEGTGSSEWTSGRREKRRSRGRFRGRLNGPGGSTPRPDRGSRDVHCGGARSASSLGADDRNAERSTRRLPTYPEPDPERWAIQQRR